MDRSIVYPGSIPLDTDLLTTNRNTMVALGALAAATIGTQTTIDGLSVAPGTGLAVVVAPGCITSFGALDQNAYGSLPADVNDSVLRLGINLAAVSLGLRAPQTASTAIVYLIQAAFQEIDMVPIVLPYYNAAQPSQPFLGPANSGAAQPTARSQRVALAAKAGMPAASGSAAAPYPDPGWVGLSVVTVNAGQQGVAWENIATLNTARSIPVKLGDLRSGYGSAQLFASTGAFTVPPGVTALRVTVSGGGGAGGTHATLPSGGGGASGWASGWFYGFTPGMVIAAVVGPGGASSGLPANGQVGGSSGFGSYIAASGGAGGQGGRAFTTCAGAAGGLGYGGSLQSGGSYGSDAIVVAQRGGDGGGPGGSRGSTGYAAGLPAPGYGGGGGGGGASASDGSGLGAQGGAGGNGFVLVEY